MPFDYNYDPNSGYDYTNYKDDDYYSSSGYDQFDQIDSAYYQTNQNDDIYNESGRFTPSALGAATDNLQGDMYSSVEAIARTFGLEEAEKWAEQQAAISRYEASKYISEGPNKIENVASVSDLYNYSKNALVSTLPQIGMMFAGGVLGKALAGAKGATALASATSTPMHVGDIYEKQKSTDSFDPSSLYAGAAANVLMESIPVNRFIKITNDYGGGTLAKSVAKGAIAEAPVEMAQGAVGDYAANINPENDSEYWSNRLNEGVAGGIVGSVVGGTGYVGGKSIDILSRNTTYDQDPALSYDQDPVQAYDQDIRQKASMSSAQDQQSIRNQIAREGWAYPEQMQAVMTSGLDPNQKDAILDIRNVDKFNQKSTQYTSELDRMALKKSMFSLNKNQSFNKLGKAYQALLQSSLAQGTQSDLEFEEAKNKVEYVNNRAQIFKDKTRYNAGDLVSAEKVVDTFTEDSTFRTEFNNLVEELVDANDFQEARGDMSVEDMEFRSQYLDAIGENNLSDRANDFLEAWKTGSIQEKERDDSGKLTGKLVDTVYEYDDAFLNSRVSLHLDGLKQQEKETKREEWEDGQKGIFKGDELKEEAFRLVDSDNVSREEAIDWADSFYPETRVYKGKKQEIPDYAYNKYNRAHRLINQFFEEIPARKEKQAQEKADRLISDARIAETSEGKLTPDELYDRITERGGALRNIPYLNDITDKALDDNNMGFSGDLLSSLRKNDSKLDLDAYQINYIENRLDLLRSKKENSEPLDVSESEQNILERGMGSIENNPVVTDEEALQYAQNIGLTGGLKTTLEDDGDNGNEIEAKSANVAYQKQFLGLGAKKKSGEKWEGEIDYMLDPRVAREIKGKTRQSDFEIFDKQLAEYNTSNKKTYKRVSMVDAIRADVTRRFKGNEYENSDTTETEILGEEGSYGFGKSKVVKGDKENSKIRLEERIQKQMREVAEDIIESRTNERMKAKLVEKYKDGTAPEEVLKYFSAIESTPLDESVGKGEIELDYQDKLLYEKPYVKSNNNVYDTSKLSNGFLPLKNGKQLNVVDAIGKVKARLKKQEGYNKDLDKSATARVLGQYLEDINLQDVDQYRKERVDTNLDATNKQFDENSDLFNATATNSANYRAISRLITDLISESKGVDFNKLYNVLPLKKGVTINQLEKINDKVKEALVLQSKNKKDAPNVYLTKTMDILEQAKHFKPAVLTEMWYPYLDVKAILSDERVIRAKFDQFIRNGFNPRVELKTPRKLVRVELKPKLLTQRKLREEFAGSEEEISESDMDYAVQFALRENKKEIEAWEDLPEDTYPDKNGIPMRYWNGKPIKANKKGKFIISFRDEYKDILDEANANDVSNPRNTARLEMYDTFGEITDVESIVDEKTYARIREAKLANVMAEVGVDYKWTDTKTGSSYKKFDTAVSKLSPTAETKKDAYEESDNMRISTMQKELKRRNKLKEYGDWYLYQPWDAFGNYKDVSEESLRNNVDKIEGVTAERLAKVKAKYAEWVMYSGARANNDKAIISLEARIDYAKNQQWEARNSDVNSAVDKINKRIDKEQNEAKLNQPGFDPREPVETRSKGFGRVSGNKDIDNKLFYTKRAKKRVISSEKRRAKGKKAIPFAFMDEVSLTHKQSELQIKLNELEKLETKRKRYLEAVKKSQEYKGGAYTHLPLSRPLSRKEKARLAFLKPQLKDIKSEINDLIKRKFEIVEDTSKVSPKVGPKEPVKYVPRAKHNVNMRLEYYKKQLQELEQLEKRKDEYNKGVSKAKKAPKGIPIPKPLTKEEQARLKNKSNILKELRALENKISVPFKQSSVDSYTEDSLEDDTFTGDTLLNEGVEIVNDDEIAGNDRGFADNGSDAEDTDHMDFDKVNTFEQEQAMKWGRGGALTAAANAQIKIERSKFDQTGAPEINVLSKSLTKMFTAIGIAKSTYRTQFNKFTNGRVLEGVELDKKEKSFEQSVFFEQVKEANAERELAIKEKEEAEKTYFEAMNKWLNTREEINPFNQFGSTENLKKGVKVRGKVIKPSTDVKSVKNEEIIRLKLLEDSSKNGFVIPRVIVRGRNTAKYGEVKNTNDVDIYRASIASKYIGFRNGTNKKINSSHAKKAGLPINGGEYKDKDLIFVDVSVNPSKKDLDSTVDEITTAVQKGAMVLTYSSEFLESHKNLKGAIKLQEILKQNNLVEITSTRNKNTSAWVLPEANSDVRVAKKLSTVASKQALVKLAKVPATHHKNFSMKFKIGTGVNGINKAARAAVPKAEFIKDLMPSGVRTGTTRSKNSMLPVGDTFTVGGIDGVYVVTAHRQVGPSHGVSWNEWSAVEGWSPKLPYTEVEQGKGRYKLPQYKIRDGSWQMLFERIDLEEGFVNPETPVTNTLPDYVPGQKTMRYAGVGSRNTPPKVLAAMRKVATRLEELGFTLQSGNAKGADKAFESGVRNNDNKQVFLPDEMFMDTEINRIAKAVAREMHARPDVAFDIKDGLTPKQMENKTFAKNAASRNMKQIMGEALHSPVDFALVWTPNGETSYSDVFFKNKNNKTGGTGTAISLASRKGVPVINMANKNWAQDLKRFLEDRYGYVKANDAMSTVNLDKINADYKAATKSGIQKVENNARLKQSVRPYQVVNNMPSSFTKTKHKKATPNTIKPSKISKEKEYEAGADARRNVTIAEVQLIKAQDKLSRLQAERSAFLSKNKNNTGILYDTNMFISKIKVARKDVFDRKMALKDASKKLPEITGPVRKMANLSSTEMETKGTSVNKHGVKGVKDEARQLKDRRVSDTKVIIGDIWAQDGIKIVSTNLGGVHGRGLAKQAEDKGKITNRNKDFDSSPKNSDVITLAVKGKAPETAKKKGREFSEQVVDGNVNLLKSEVKKLIRYARINKDINFYLPFIGLGFGEGNAKDIQPVLDFAASEPNIYLVSKDDNTVSKYSDSFKPGVRQDGIIRSKTLTNEATVYINSLDSLKRITEVAKVYKERGNTEALKLLRTKYKDMRDDATNTLAEMRKKANAARKDENLTLDKADTVKNEIFYEANRVYLIDNAIGDKLYELHDKAAKAFVEDYDSMRDADLSITSKKLSYKAPKETTRNHRHTQNLANKYLRGSGVKVKIISGANAEKIGAATGVDVSSIRNGVAHGFADPNVNQDGTYNVYISPKLKGALKEEIIRHELGHVVMYATKFNKHEQGSKGILAQYLKWRKEHGKDISDLRQMLKSMKAPESAGEFIKAWNAKNGKTVGSLSNTNKEYITSFEEWFADQVGKALVMTESPTTTVQKFFAKIVKALNRIFNINFNSPIRKANTVNKGTSLTAIETFVDGLKNWDTSFNTEMKQKKSNLSTVFDASMKENGLFKTVKDNLLEGLLDKDTNLRILANEGDKDEIPSLVELANRMFKNQNAKGVDNSYWHNKLLTMANFDTRASEIMKGTSIDLRNKIMGELYNEKLPDNKATYETVQIRSLFKDLAKYMEDAGVKVPKRRNYFPQIVDIDYIESKHDEFIDMMNRYPNEMKSIASKWNKDLKKRNDFDGVETMPGDFIKQEDVPQALYENIVRGDVIDEANSFGQQTPNVRFLKHRIIDFLNESDTKEWRSNYLQSSVTDASSTYITQAVKRVEYEKRFGKLNKEERKIYITELMTKDGKEPSEYTALEVKRFEKRADAFSKLEFLLNSAKKEGASEEVLQSARNTVYAELGILGKDTALLLNKYLGIPMPPSYSPINKKLQYAISTLISASNIMVLGLSTVTSLVDPVGVAVRSGSLSQALSSSINGIKEAFRGNKTELTILAEAVGSVNDVATKEALSHGYNMTNMTPSIRKMNDTFFKLIGLEQWTKTTRLMAVDAAQGFFKRHDTSPNKNSKRFLDEFGIQRGDLKYGKDGKVKVLSYMEHKNATSEEKAANDRVKSAIASFVDQSILRPSPSQRPIRASDPHLAMLFHLKSFMYSFQKTILNPVYREARLGNFAPLLALGAYVPAGMFAAAIKDVIKTIGDDDDDFVPAYKEDWSALQYIADGAERSGLAGITQPVFDMYNSSKYGDSSFSSMLGPSMDYRTFTSLPIPFKYWYNNMYTYSDQ